MNGQNLEIVMSKFDIVVTELKKWCFYNKTDINWTKTEVMFISKKMEYNDEGLYRLKKFPTFLTIDNNNIKVVDSFKLLGITIDNKLNFSKFVGDIRLAINRRLYSIKKLFYLSFQVKLQFFKTFLFPYFDYCSTIFIYFNKSAIQKIANCYYLCLSRLLNFKFTAKFNESKFDFNHLNNELEKLNLQSFQHRVLSRLLTFGHKIVNLSDSPENLSELLSTKGPVNHTYDLRNNQIHESLNVPSISYLNNFGTRTFEYVFPKLLNLTCILDIKISSKLFNIRVYNNINLYYSKFIQSFQNFDLNFALNFNQLL